MDELSRLAWRTSSRSGGQGQCVEVGIAPGLTGVRDTKERGGGTLAFRSEVWRSFLSELKTGSYDR